MSLAAGTFFHLMEDQMWGDPRTLFWPFLGFSFPKDSIDNATIGIKYLATLFKNSFSLNISPASIPEILGMVVILILIIQLLLAKFKVKKGEKIPDPNEKPDTLLSALYILGFILCGYVILMSYYIISGD